MNKNLVVNVEYKYARQIFVHKVVVEGHIVFFSVYN